MVLFLGDKIKIDMVNWAFVLGLPPFKWLDRLIGERLRLGSEIGLLDEKERRELVRKTIDVVTDGESIGWKSTPSEANEKRAYRIARRVEINFGYKGLAFLIRRYMAWWSLHAASFSDKDERESRVHRLELRSHLEEIMKELEKEIRLFRDGKKSSIPEINPNNLS